MKIRIGFVSNSSSSSFVCDMCGYTEVGWDGQYGSEVRYCVCEHSMCEDCAPDESEIKLTAQQKRDLIIEHAGYWMTEEEKKDLQECDDEEALDDWLSEATENLVLEVYCPICNFEFLTDNVLKRYLVKYYAIPEEEVFATIKEANKRRKKLYASEYNAYVIAKLQLDPLKIQEELKTKFKSFSEFWDATK